MNSVESLDIFAIVWFAVCYIGYTLFTNYGPFSNNSLMSKMHLVRLAWMHQMVDRDNRMVDVNILEKNLQRKSFFCINCGHCHRWADPLPSPGPVQFNSYVVSLLPAQPRSRYGSCKFC